MTALQGCELVLVDHLRIVQQPADQRALPVVHAPAREEPQELLLLVLLEVGVDVGGDEVGVVRHLNVEFGMRSAELNRCNARSVRRWHGTASYIARLATVPRKTIGPEHGHVSKGSQMQGNRIEDVFTNSAKGDY